MLGEMIKPSIGMRSYLRSRAAPLLVFFYQLTVLVYFVFIPIQAYTWLTQPFLGAFVEHTLMLNTAAPSRPGTWELQGFQLPFGHQIVALDSTPVSSVPQLNLLLSQHRPGQQVDLDLRLTVAGLFDVYTTNVLTPMWTVSLALAGGALFNLALVFPEESPWLSRYP